MLRSLIKFRELWQWLIIALAQTVVLNDNAEYNHDVIVNLKGESLSKGHFLPLY